MKIGYLVLLPILLISCEIPSIETTDFGFYEVESTTLVGSSIGFPDLWFSQNGRIQGVYELPQRIPVALAEGKEGILQAGIRENGIASSPRVYPFTKNIEFEIMLEKGEVVELKPQFTYLDETKIRLDSDFTLANDFGFDEDGNGDLNLIVADGVGKLMLPGGSFIEAATSTVFTQVPTNGTPVFVEIEYKGNLDLSVGLIGIADLDKFKEYFVSLRSEDKWKKAYINLTELVIASELDGYQLVLKADNSMNSVEAEIQVDNIKLLHF